MRRARSKGVKSKRENVGKNRCKTKFDALEMRERRWFVLERPRRDTNGGRETEVTVTS